MDKMDERGSTQPSMHENTTGNCVPIEKLNGNDFLSRLCDNKYRVEWYAHRTCVHPIWRQCFNTRHWLALCIWCETDVRLVSNSLDVTWLDLTFISLLAPFTPPISLHNNMMEWTRYQPLGQWCDKAEMTPAERVFVVVVVVRVKTLFMFADNVQWNNILCSVFNGLCLKNASSSVWCVCNAYFLFFITG